MDRAIDLTIDTRYLPIGRREEAVLQALCSMPVGRSMLVISDAGFHALEVEIALAYPGKFATERLPEEPHRYRAIMTKLGDTPPFRAEWESALDSPWDTSRDP